MVVIFPRLWFMTLNSDGSSSGDLSLLCVPSLLIGLYAGRRTFDHPTAVLALCCSLCYGGNDIVGVLK